MQFLHQPSMSAADFVAPRASLQAKDLIRLLRRHFAARRRAAMLASTPSCRCVMRVFTPSGKPAVKITFQKGPALFIEPAPQPQQIGERELTQAAARFGSGNHAPVKGTATAVERQLYKLRSYLGLLSV
jgi:hypothetical protein